MSLSEELARIEAQIPDPKTGLPEAVFEFATRITPMINVDLLIRDSELGVLLTWRDDGLWTPGWHIPGGIIRFQEPIADRIGAVARGELGTGVEFGSTPLAIREFIIPELPCRNHFISLLYACSLTGEPDPVRCCRGEVPCPGEWRWHRQCPENLLSVHEKYREFL